MSLPTFIFLYQSLVSNFAAASDLLNQIEIETQYEKCLYSVTNGMCCVLDSCRFLREAPSTPGEP